MSARRLFHKLAPPPEKNLPLHPFVRQGQARTASLWAFLRSARPKPPSFFSDLFDSDTYRAKGMLHTC